MESCQKLLQQLWVRLWNGLPLQTEELPILSTPSPKASKEMNLQDLCQKISDLVNQNNQLSCPLTLGRVKETIDQYRWKLIDDHLVYCVRVRRSSWFQSEISHLSVNPDYQGKKFGKEALVEAEHFATELGSKVSCCTVRSDNIKSINLFEKTGYSKASEFVNQVNGRLLHLYIKTLSCPTT